MKQKAAAWRFFDAESTLQAQDLLLLPNMADKPGSRVAIAAECSEIEATLAWIALANQGFVPVLGVQGQRAMNAAAMPVLAMPDLRNTLPTKEAIAAECLAPLFAADSQQEICFMTSGTTGYGKVISKEMGALLQEAKIITQILQLSEGTRVGCMVSVRHIYGFLFGCLAPILANAQVYLSHSLGSSLPPALEGEQKEAAEVIIAVPAQWSLVKQIIAEAPPKLIVMSGGAFGDTRLAEWKAMLANWSSLEQPPQILEFFGSTETGGLGYRNVLSGPFRLYDAVSLEGKVGGCYEVLSPYCPAGTFLADNIEYDPEERLFTPLGRVDSVFKFAGKRLSLVEVNEALAKALQLNPAKIQSFYLRDDRSAHGGRLISYVFGQATGNFAELPSRVGDIPMPEKITFIANLPLPERGKIGLDYLESIPSEIKEVWGKR